MNANLRTCLAAGLLAWVLCCSARGDSLLVGQRQWPGAKIQWFQDGKVRFTAADGSQQAVPIPTVTRLQVDLRDDLNRAEQLRFEGHVPEAVAAYESALRTENRNDVGSFIRYRLMDLYGQGGQLDQAVEMFLDLVKQPDFHAVVKDWRPTGAATARPKVREAAIVALEDALRQIRTGLASESVSQLRDFLKSLPAGQAAAAPRPPASPPAAPAPSGAARGAPAAAAPDAAAEAPEPEAFVPELNEPGPALKALQARQYAEALTVANGILVRSDLTREQLAECLYVRGVAQWNLAKDAPGYLQAGWALSRMLVEFPASPRTAEALYYLGLVHQRLGQAAQARQLLQQAAQTASSRELRERAQKALRDSAGRG